ncbi:short transient receptor potential channel 4 [Plakobranchus ocellatus]|uniref:Short transient receptor potential channel 4 n=1 Tax=Plakobranchus ocellatus TaxID=259542 RepID=A0AAV4CDX8_9GAST|nr:short transient receptor potential channel 4 [Plakobranchus ocellatus]
MDKVYLAYRESLLKAAPRMMEELGIDTGEDFLGMGVFRKDVDLSNEEKQYLLSVERGDVPSTRQYLAQAKATGMNLNCLDPLGRTALLVAIENENIEMIELLLSHGVEVGDALLHAINEENVEAVEMLLNHEIITKGEQQAPSQSKFKGSVGGTVDSESALRPARTFCRGFEPCHRRLGLTESMKA